MNIDQKELVYLLYNAASISTHRVGAAILLLGAHLGHKEAAMIALSVRASGYADPDLFSSAYKCKIVAGYAYQHEHEDGNWLFSIHGRPTDEIATIVHFE
jgi:hypothetical protein